MGKNVDKSIQLLYRLKQLGIQPNEISYVPIVRFYFSVFDEAKATQMINQMKEEGVRLSLSTYSTILNYYLTKSLFHRVPQLLEEMKQEGVEHDAIFTKILNQVYEKEKEKSSSGST